MAGFVMRLMLWLVCLMLIGVVMPAYAFDGCPSNYGIVQVVSDARPGAEQSFIGSSRIVLWGNTHGAYLNLNMGTLEQAMYPWAISPEFRSAWGIVRGPAIGGVSYTVCGRAVVYLPLLAQ